MNDDNRLRLSELQDGRLDAGHTAHLLDAMGCDQSLGATWERYQLIGLAIRGEGFDPRHREIAERVRLALDAEPAVLAKRRLHPISRKRIQRAAGFAIAASVASVAYINGPALLGVLAPQPAGEAQLAAQDPAPDNERWHLDRPGLENKLDVFLVTHQATVPEAGPRAMLPYATLVGYDQSR